MPLILHSHPLSTFGQKAVVAIYELDAPVELRTLEFGDEAAVERLRRLWPLARIPVLEDTDAERAIPETSIIIEHLDRRFGGRLVPSDPEAALRVRLLDRIFDLHVQEQMQRVVHDRLRPADQRDPFGVRKARAALRQVYDLLEEELADPWAAGEDFTLADCSAAPALYYAGRVEPFEGAHPRLAAYWSRLQARPSYARAFDESRPYLQFFPSE